MLVFSEVHNIYSYLVGEFNFSSLFLLKEARKRMMVWWLVSNLYFKDSFE